MYKCQECGADTDTSYFREDNNETVCEDCYIEWYRKINNIR